MTKLTDSRIRWICRHVADIGDWTKPRAAELYGISVRRVEQLVKTYREMKAYPTLNPNRRPRAPPLTKEEKAAIDEVWNEKRFGARLLYKELRSRGMKIPQHKIHAYLKKTCRARPNPNKQKKRKRCRYERKHSFSLVHGDWHRTSENHPHAILWLDDASRYILSCGEFDSATTAHSIKTFELAVREAAGYNGIINQVNTDRGTQFFQSQGKSLFEVFLEGKGIQFIPSRKSNPQTNGKLERLWLEYDRHRWRFGSVQEFADWYNDRMHGALWMEIAESPKMAVTRKNRPESTLGLLWRLNL
jgi:putative transposase